MRVLTVTHFFESHGGGIERVAGQLCRQFAALGANSAWVASDSDPAPAGETAAIPLRCFNPTETLTGLPMPIPGPAGVRTLMREVRRSDAVIIHDALYATSILAMLIAKLRRKRVILIQHIAGIPFSSGALRAVMAAANFLVTRPMLWAADTPVFISDTVRRELLGNVPRLSSELLFNGVDGTVFHAAERDRDPPAAVASIGTAHRVLFVGRYVEKKGLSVLHALADLRSDLSFVLAGTGPIRPDAWGLANVHDLGSQPPEALAELYRWADVLILPSVGEGYPLVIQEAMASGLPVVCGTPSDRADPDAAHWLLGVEIDLADPKSSAQRCSEAIDALRPSNAERTAMAQYALRQYDWGAMAQRLLALAGAEAKPA